MIGMFDNDLQIFFQFSPEMLISRKETTDI